MVLVGHVCWMALSAPCAPSVVTTSGGPAVSKSLLYNQADSVKPQTQEVTWVLVEAMKRQFLLK